MIEVVRWISSEEAEKYESSIGGLGGFFDNGMRGQKDYFNKLKPDRKEYAEALRKEIIKNNIRIKGSEHDNGDEGTPLFSDNTVGSFSWRAWGDLMAAIWSEQEDKDYCYMDFYC